MNSVEIVATPAYSAPFDSIADVYDDAFTNSSIGRAQRAVVWKQLDKTFTSGDRVLEIGCGTGVDACHLADRGVAVTACDNSQRMIQLTARRVERHQKQALVDARLLAAENLNDLAGNGLFDGAFSNFGALNCVRDPADLASTLARLLRPGAIALLCWMGPFCLWEVIFYLVRRDPDKALRRLRRNGVIAKLGNGPAVRVTYPSVRSLARAFAPHFRLTSMYGVGVFVPPSYCEQWSREFPHLLRLAEQGDSVAGKCPGIRMLADHILLSFERRPV